MNKIDWTKPIETDIGTEATLLRVLDTKHSCKYLVTYMLAGNEHANLFDETGLCATHKILAGRPGIRNKAEPSVLYGRLEPQWRGDIQGTAWTHARGASDTHVMTLTPDDVARLIKPIKDKKDA